MPHAQPRPSPDSAIDSNESALEREADAAADRAVSSLGTHSRAFAAGQSAAGSEPGGPARRDGPPRPTVLGMLERHFGHDFSNVRIHADREAARSARVLKAQAFTLGSDIYFADGRYRPSTKAGLRLLAHELAHTAQQSGRPHAPWSVVGAPRLSRAPTRIQRQSDNETEGPHRAMGIVGDDGTFIYGSGDRFPTRDEVLQFLVESGVLNPEIAEELTATPIGDVRNPSGWSLALGKWEVVRFRLVADTTGGKTDFVAQGGVRLAGGKGKGAGGTGTQTQPKGGSGGGKGDAQKEDALDKELKSNPHWQHLSKQDRELLKEYAKLTPEELSKDPDQPAPNMADVKLSIALKLSSGWPGEVAEAAKNAFSDPAFVIMLIVTLAIYVGLWLVPEPTLITKALAGLLTAVLLLQFAWEDIYGLAKAWMDLEDECKGATTVGELKTAGDRFSKKVGSVGFDILLFIATWGLGKAVGPKLAKVGTARGVARAEAGVRGAEARVGSAESKPGSGVVGDAPIESRALIDRAKGSAKGSTATAVLDALSDLLPDAAKRGLKALRDANPSDMDALRTLEGIDRGGKDVTKFLTDKATSPEATKAARAEVAAARAELGRSQLNLARAKLVESRLIQDPTLRENVRQQQYSAIRAALKQIGALDKSALLDALKQGDFAKIVGELRSVIGEASRPAVTETQGAIGEAMLRSLIEGKYAGRRGIKFFRNVAIMRRLAGFRSITEWRASRQARIQADTPDISDDALRRQLGREAAHLFEDPDAGAVYDAVGEIDVLVADASAAGKPQAIELGEVKTGAGDTAVSAAVQLEQSASALAELSRGGRGSDLKVFELEGKKTLGTDLTNALDYSRIGAATRTTLGPQGRAFGQQMELTASELNGLAESLLKNMPPGKPQTIPPTSLPRKDPADTSTP